MSSAMHHLTDLKTADVLPAESVSGEESDTLFGDKKQIPDSDSAQGERDGKDTASVSGGKSGVQDEIDRMMKVCRLCPRNCGTDRVSGQCGVCGVPADVYVARAALHFWEEPCISGTDGSGAVFFSGCGLKCLYCQNAPISGVFPQMPVNSRRQPPKGGRSRPSLNSRRQPPADGPDSFPYGVPGISVTIRRLADIFLCLQNEKHANNINLVTATQYIPQVAAALRMAKAEGLIIPIVYNSGGYEKVSSLRLLEGLVDIWLPDFKYMDSGTAGSYSHAPDYPEYARAAIEEMVRQAGEPEFYEKNGQTLMKKGVIVRHLLLPGHVRGAKKVLSYLHETYGDLIYISIMNQYTPVLSSEKGARLPEGREYDLLRRKVTKREYERLIDYAIDIGIGKGFIQEGGTARESFIPSWNGEGVV